MKTCIAPLSDVESLAGVQLCGQPATTTRTIEGNVCAFCTDHAHEIDCEVDFSNKAMYPRQSAVRQLRAWCNVCNKELGKGWRCTRCIESRKARSASTPRAK